MWLLSQSVFDYLKNEKISYKARDDYARNKAWKIRKEFKKLSSEEIIELLFNSRIPKSAKKIICKEIEKLSQSLDENNKDKYYSIKKEFVLSPYQQEKYIYSSYCPKEFKKLLINNYFPDYVDAVVLSTTPVEVKKAIIDLCIRSKEAVDLLSKNVSLDLKQYIIINCINSFYDINAILSNIDIDDGIKRAVLLGKVNLENVFSLMDETYIPRNRNFIFNVVEKDYEDYIMTLDGERLLHEFNTVKFPMYFARLIIEKRKNDLLNAITVASDKEVFSLVFGGRDNALANYAFSTRGNSVIKALDLYNGRILGLLNNKYIPEELQNVVISKYSLRLNEEIRNSTIKYLLSYGLSKNSNLPDSVVDRIISIRYDDLISELSRLNKPDVLNMFLFGHYNLEVYKLLISLKVEENNLFDMLGFANLDVEVAKAMVDLKKDIIIKRLEECNTSDIFSLKVFDYKSEISNYIIEECSDLIIERLKDLSNEEIIDYLCSSEVLFSTKKIILSYFGIDDVDLQNCFEALEVDSLKILLNNYSKIRDFINDLGISFNSFLQYGSGSKKYPNWVFDINNIIDNNRDSFSKCKKYFFNNYYNKMDEDENAVYQISSFLEFVNNYSKYRELFEYLTNNNILLGEEDKKNLAFLFNISSDSEIEIPKDLDSLRIYRNKVYEKYASMIDDKDISLEQIKKIYNDLLFCSSLNVLNSIGGSETLLTLRKDNSTSNGLCLLIDEALAYSGIMELVENSNDVDGLRVVLQKVLSSPKILTEFQDLFSVFDKKITRLFELDSAKNLTPLYLADSLIDTELSKKYGGLVYDFSNKNYVLYAHALSGSEFIDNVISGKSNGQSNFISVSPVSYKGQRYYANMDETVFLYDRIPKGGFICSSIYNMSTNKVLNRNSSEVDGVSRKQRGILETSSVVENNAETLLYREGLVPCGLALPGGREPYDLELQIHKKYGLPFIITQKVATPIKHVDMFFNTEDSIKCDTDVVKLRSLFDLVQEDISIISEDDIYTGREIAIIADPHAMYEPTLAVLEDMRKRGITERYSLGDEFNEGPNPVEVYDLLQQYGVISIAGNGEYHTTLGMEPFEYFYDEKIKNQVWTNNMLGDERISKLKLYPAFIDLVVGGKKVALCHFINDVRFYYKPYNSYVYQQNYSLGRSNSSEQFRYENSSQFESDVDEKIKEYGEDSPRSKAMQVMKKEPLFEGRKATDYDAIVQGHVHFDMTDKLDDTDIYTLRAVGMGYGNDPIDTACYYVMKEKKDGGFDFEKRLVPFNRNNLISSIVSGQLPDCSNVLRYVTSGR